MATWTRRGLLVAAAGVPACFGARLDDFPFDGALTAPEGGTDDLQVQFFSVGCFHVRWRDLAVVTDPFFTHVPLRAAAFGDVLPDPAAAPAPTTWATTHATLVGHGHYDHCLGLPTIAPHLHPDAQLLGSATAGHTFAPLDLPRPWTAVDALAASHDTSGRWVSLAGGRLRVLAIRSGHPDNVRGIHLYQGDLTEDRATPPTSAGDYLEGPTFAYLVDLLDADGAIAHRVYVETSSTGPPAGRAPQAVFAERRVDVALLAMDCANFRAAGEPSILDHIDPRAVLFCHWGDFFRPKDAPPRETVKVDLPWTREVLRAEPGGERYRFPGWGSHHRFARDA